MGDLSIGISLGPVSISITAEDCSWNPSVARDMQDRLIDMLSASLEQASQYGLIAIGDTSDGE